MAKLILVPILLPLILSCAGSVADNPSGGTWRMTASSTCTADPNGDPFSCIRSKCEQSGGHYEPRNATCDCGDGKVFLAWGAGRCEAAPELNKCLKESNGFSRALSHSDLNSCFTLVQRGKTSVYLNSLNTTNDEKTGNRDFAEWADSHLPQASRRIAAQPVLFQDLNITWAIGPGSIESIGEPGLSSLISSYSVLLTEPREITPLSVYYHFDSSDNIDDALNSGLYEGRVILPPPPEGSPADLEPLREITNQALSGHFQADHRTFYTDDGCAGHCELTQQSTVNARPISRTREYVGGNLLSDTLFVWEDATRSRAYAMVSLLPSGQVSLIHLVQRSDQSSGTTQLLHSVYDRQWRPLLREPHRRVVIAQTEALLEQIGKLTEASQATALPQAIVCESGFTAETIEKLGADTFLRGPFSFAERDADQRRSLFGWLDSPFHGRTMTESISGTFLSGAAEVSELGVRPALVNFASHAVKVTRNITENDGLTKIIPIGIGQCAENGESWLPLIKRYTRARVINMSSFGSYTQKACRDSSLGRQVAQNRDELLYVVAAGNDGIDGDGQSIPTCPQSLSGLPNLVVVASGSENDVNWTSNRGHRYADIVADGSHAEEGPQSYATSFATPRVTRLAAQLFSEFPKLQPARIRKAILFGASIPSRYGRFSPLPVRSGGFLNEAKARAIAEIMVENPSLGDSEILAKAYCWRYQFWSCADRDVRLKLFTENP